MNIGEPFTFVFQDPEWPKKLAIGAGLILLGAIFSPVLIGLAPLLVVLGYGVAVTRNVMNGVERPLPEWGDWGELLVQGLKLAAILLIWSLPVLALSLFSSLLQALAEEGSQSSLVALGLLCCPSLTVILGIACALVIPVLTFHFARTGEFASGFEFSEIFRLLGERIGHVVVAVLVSAAGRAVLLILGVVVGLLALGVGLLATVPAAAFLTQMAQAHLYGQVGRGAH